MVEMNGPILYSQKDKKKFKYQNVFILLHLAFFKLAHPSILRTI